MRLIDGLHLGNVLIPERIKKKYIEALQISTKGLLLFVVENLGFVRNRDVGLLL